MSSNQINAKINCGIVEFEFPHLTNWFKDDLTRTVVYNFFKVFELHGIMRTQIQRIIPEISLDVLNNPEKLFQALSNDVLDKTATLFGVKRAWLEGVDGEMYSELTAYQAPWNFFNAIKEMKQPFVTFPLRAYSVKSLDRSDKISQKMVLVLVEQVCEWDNCFGKIVRYRPLTDPWHWGNPKSRVFLKALIMAYYKHINQEEIRVYKTDPTTMKSLIDGACLPPFGCEPCNCCLEDFILTREDNLSSKEEDEVEVVRDFMANGKWEIEKYAKEAAEALSIELSHDFKF